MENKDKLKELKKILKDDEKIDSIINYFEERGFKYKIGFQQILKQDRNFYYSFLFKKNFDYYINIRFYFKDNKFDVILLYLECVNQEDIDVLYVYSIEELEKRIKEFFQYIKENIEKKKTISELLDELKETLHDYEGEIDKIISYLLLNNFRFLKNKTIKRFDGTYNLYLEKDNDCIVMQFCFNNEKFDEVALYIQEDSIEVFFGKLENLKELKEKIIEFV